jgi:2'-hydroxyisoflavone reductase
MKILVIGGGIFVGRAVLEAAQARGHAVTVFNRGRATAAFPPGVEWIKGDRDADLGGLGGRTWDAVIDTCAYLPRQVESLLQALAGRMGHYQLVSSVSAYASLAEPGGDEGRPTAPALVAVPGQMTPETYGPLKSMCEHAALQAGPRGTSLVRPGIIVGPWDPTGRFTHWVRRLAAGGEVLAPGDPAAPLQVIDVRDVAALMVAIVEGGLTGAYNAVGPAAPLTWGDMLAESARALGVPASFTWVDDAFVAEHKVGGWADLPLYLPAAAEKFAGMYRIDGTRARRHGLRLRPLGETVADLARWLQDPAAAGVKRMGLSPERETELLAEWHRRGR